MIRSVRKFIFSAIIFALVAFPSIIFAQVSGPGSAMGLPNPQTYQLLAPLPSFGDKVLPNNFSGYAQSLITLIIGAAAVLAVIMIMVGGFMYMGGESVRTKSTGSSFIKHAIGGLLLLLGSYLVLNTINPQLLNLNLSLQTIPQGGYAPGITPQTLASAYCYATSGDVTPSGGDGCSASLDQCRAAQAADPTSIGDCTPLLNFQYIPQSSGPAGPAPSAQTVLAALSGNQALIDAAAARYGIPVELLEATIYHESGGAVSATSPVGAAGIIQMMPDTARSLDPGDFAGMSDAQIRSTLNSNPELAINLGAQYLSQGYTATGGNVDLTLARYNGGPGAILPSKTCSGQLVYECLQNPGYAETRKYVPAINGIINNLNQTTTSA